MSKINRTDKDLKLTIIIPCFNSSKFILNCLASIYIQSNVFFEVIIVDDGSTDDSLQILQKLSYPFKLICLKTNQGASYCRNQGAKSAKAPILLFLDIDTYVLPNCLINIISYLNMHSDIGALQLALLNKDRKTYETCGHFISPVGFPYEVGVNTIVNTNAKPEQILGARSAGLAVRKELFHAINGFDQKYIIYGEDTDLCWRLWLSGFKIVFLPSAQVIHYQKSSLSTQTQDRIYFEGTKNTLRNILKNLDFNRLIYVLPLFFIAFAMQFLKQIISGRLHCATKMLQAVWWNMCEFPSTLKLREHRHFLNANIVFGTMPWRLLITKAWRWLKYV